MNNEEKKNLDENCYPVELKLEPNVIEKKNNYLDVKNLPCFVKELLAGGIAGGVAKTAVAPLERVKILFQTRKGHFQSDGVLRSLFIISQKEGIVGFYRGNGASVTRVIPYAALHFMAYERYRKALVDKYPSTFDSPLVDLLAGSLAGATAVVFTYPLDLIHTKLAYQVGVNSDREYRGVRDALWKTFRHGGVRELYRGAGATLWGILPYAGLKFYVYESLKRVINKNENGQISIISKLTCGAISGLVGQTVTYPLDVIRRQMQVQGPLDMHLNSNPIHFSSPSPSPSPSPPLSSSPVCFNNTMHGLSFVIRNQGWKQLYSGLSINYIKMIPSVAIGFTVYDSLKLWLQVPPRERAKEASSS